MSFQVESIAHFEKEAKRLKRKYKSLNSEISDLIDELEINPFTGIAMRNGFYKIRLAIKSKGKGKRGGARIITYVKIVNETVYLISIYDKSEQTDISDGELDRLILEISE